MHPSAESVRSSRGNLNLDFSLFIYACNPRHSETRQYKLLESIVAHSHLLSNGMPEILRERPDLFLPFFGLLSVNILLVALVVGLSVWAFRWARQSKQVSPLKTGNDVSNEKIPDITPLHDFNWKTTEPMKFRPFVGREKYNMTMGISPEEQYSLPQICAKTC